MDYFIATLVAVSVLGMSISGSRMGRHATALFNELREIDPALWHQLGSPQLSNPFKASGLFKGHMLVSFQSQVLTVHPELSNKYGLARKWHRRLFLFNLLIPVAFISLVVKNSL